MAVTSARGTGRAAEREIRWADVSHASMKRFSAALTLRDNALVLLAAWTAALILDFVYVRFAWREFVYGASVAVFLVAIVAFLRINWKSTVHESSRSVRITFTTLATLVLAIVWFSVGSLLLLWFHFQIGGVE